MVAKVESSVLYIKRTSIEAEGKVAEAPRSRWNNEGRRPAPVFRRNTHTNMLGMTAVNVLAGTKRKAD